MADDFTQYIPAGVPVENWVQVSRVPAARWCARPIPEPHKVRGPGWFHPKAGQYLCRECKIVNDEIAERGQ